MSQKALRVVLVLIVLGAMAAIPASTQVSSGSSEAAADRAGTHLSMLLVVNRLELSKAQMETLRTAIRSLLDEQAVLESKRVRFEDEMIAFNGTAEELDLRLAAFETEIQAARSSLEEKLATAVDTLKQSLTMNQGEILVDSFPGVLGRLDALTSGAANPRSQAALGREDTTTRTWMMGRGKIIIEKTSQTSDRAKTAAIIGMAQRRQMRSTETAQAATAMTSQALAERIRDRIARRLGATTGADETESAAGTIPSRTTRVRPLMGTMSESTTSADAATAGTTSLGSFGTVTISLPDASQAVSTAGGGRLINWLERFVEVLELKLAAMP